MQSNTHPESFISEIITAVRTTEAQREAFHNAYLILYPHVKAIGELNCDGGGFWHLPVLLSNDRVVCFCYGEDDLTISSRATSLEEWQTAYEGANRYESNHPDYALLFGSSDPNMETWLSEDGFQSIAKAYVEGLK